ncbi:MAG: hypothetical protein R3F30_02745 [Planctomycetota bacterium]
MKSTITLLAGALLVAPLAAQTTNVQATVKTLTPVAVLSQVGTTQKFEGWAANTNIGKSPYSMNMVQSISASPEYASSICLAYPQYYGNSVAILERGYARGATTTTGGTSASASATGAGWGAHSFLITITGPANTAGELSVSWHSKEDPTTTSIQGWIDIGNDNSVEWNPKGTMADRRTWKMTLGASPVVVKVTVQGIARGTGNALDYQDYFTDCFVGFFEDQTTTVSVTSYGAGCGGAALNGSSVLVGQEHVFTLKCTGGFANAWAISAVGNAQLGLPLPGGCSLLSNAVVLTLLKADAQGVSGEIFKSRSTKAFTSYHQYLPIDLVGNTLVLRATNGLKVVSQ